MSAVSSLVPARFLTLTAHLVIVITIFWSRENNVEACLPLDFTQDQYDKEDTKLVVALSVTMGLFAIELAGFFSGVSMFNCTQGLLYCSPCLWLCCSFCLNNGHVKYTGGSLLSTALAVHCSASVSLSFFVFQRWECWTYWVIFAFCSVLPAFVEILLFIAVFGLKKKPL
uniref:Transmembrane protein 107 n=1 Tax=Oncorhynchus tshawytscha TaxID=74940 RepID=A0A8C8G182_ONCTS